jgi:hypothetical protein
MGEISIITDVSRNTFRFRLANTTRGSPRIDAVGASIFQDQRVFNINLLTSIVTSEDADQPSMTHVAPVARRESALSNVFPPTESIIKW